MDAVLNLLGLARRGGRMTIGEDTTSAAVRNGKAYLILLASDASEHLVRSAAHFGLPMLRLEADKLTLGGALGKSTCGIAAVTDPGLAAAVAEKLGTPESLETARELRAQAERLRAREKRARTKRQTSGGSREAGKRKQR